MPAIPINIIVSRQQSDLLFPIFRLHYSHLSTQVHSKSNSFVFGRTHKSNKFLVYCNSQITISGRNGNLKEAESIFNRMPNKSIISWTAMLTAYAQNGQTIKARKVFDEMPERNTASYNAMITAYYRKNMIHEAFGLFSSMPERNSVSYAAMITGFVRAGEYALAEKLYHDMPIKWKNPVSSNVLIDGYLKVGRVDDAVRLFEGMEEKNVVSWSSMIDGYCTIGRIVDARNLFDKMPERNVVTWTTMINGYMKMENFKDGFELFMDMIRKGVGFNSTTLTVIFEACGSFGRYKEGIQVHGVVLLLGFYQFDIFLGNSMITMYSRCNCIDAAAQLFHSIPKKDIVTWNSLIAGYVQSDMIEEAFVLFQDMPQKDIVSWTTMISGFNSKGMNEKSVQLFKMMPEKDDITWTSVISGFVNNEEYEEAFHWFIEMVQNEVRPNPLTLSSMLSASANLATLSQGMQIHALVIKMVMENDLSIQNSLISMYCKSGNVSDAYRIYNSIKARNIVSFNSMITGLAQNGLGEEALMLFEKMQDQGQEPNRITFLSVLSACVHGGLVEEGWTYLKLMKSLYNIEPEPDHYACMVDLLGRAGLLDEAIDLIHTLPFKPHLGIWGAILGASRTHLRLDIADLAARKIIELDPNNATPYLVLSGLHLISGEKKDGEKIMLKKISRGIKKSPGCSWIIVKDKVHLFLSGDQSHIHMEDISVILCMMAMEMRQLNFYKKILD